jgi:hypothetical protein
VPEQDCGLSGHKMNTFLVGDGSEESVSHGGSVGEGRSTHHVVAADGDLRRLWLVAVARAQNLTPGQRNVLVVLAHFASWSTGRDAYPSVELLSRACGQAVRSVKRALAAARQAGYIEATSDGGIRGGRGMATVYRLTMPVAVVAEVRASVRKDGGGNGDQPVTVSTFGNGDRLDTVSVERVTTEARKGDQSLPKGGPASHPTSQYLSSNGGGRAGSHVLRDAAGPDPLLSGTDQEADDLSAHPGGTPGVRPSEHCPRHPGGTVDPCRACGDARRAAQAWDAGEGERRAAAYRIRQGAVAACSRCDEAGWMLGDDGLTAEPARRCSHEVVAA